MPHAHRLHSAAANDDASVPDLSEAAIGRLIDHPQFEAAMHHAAATIVELYDGNWLLNRIANDRGRMGLGLMILALSFGGEATGGFTAAQLQAEATAYGLCSRGRLTAFLATLRVAGFLKAVADDDRRLRRLVPTERFCALHRARWQRICAGLIPLDPAVETWLPLLDQHEFLGALADTLLEPFRAGIRVLNFVPLLRAAAERDAGVTVLFALWLGEQAGKPVTIAALARLFSVSRAHVLTVLREGQAAGLAVSTSDRGGFRAGPALAPALSRFCAVMFLHQLHALRQAAMRAGG